MVVLGESHGIETDNVKLFMRMTVIISDFLFYIIPVFLVSFLLYTTRPWRYNSFLAAMLVLQPAIILIDHGHFQYNCVCLGFCVLTIICLYFDLDIIAAICFCLALNFKQMALYFAPVIFFYYIRKSFSHKYPLVYILQIGLTVLFTFFLLWSPFYIYSTHPCGPIASILQVIHRLFPWERGIFEDKVASFWCNLNLFIKIRNFLSVSQLKTLALCFTLIGISPACYAVLKFTPNIKTLSIAMFSCSLSFFLFSFQVHEKTILFPLLPLLFVSLQYSFSVNYFNLIAVYSLFPLLLKDNLIIPTISLVYMYLLISTMACFTESQTSNKTFTYIVINLVVSFISLFYYYIPAPSRYPDIHTVLIGFISFIQFFIAYLYSIHLLFKGNNNTIKKEEKIKQE
ncbi:hypothetical protein WA158_004803 [Blastocystis sp. Blastoise]